MVETARSEGQRGAGRVGSRGDVASAAHVTLGLSAKARKVYRRANTCNRAACAGRLCASKAWFNYCFDSISERQCCSSLMIIDP